MKHFHFIIRVTFLISMIILLFQGTSSRLITALYSVGTYTLVYDQSGLTSPSTSVTGLSGNTVYYRGVNATNVFGTGEWSSGWSFTTTAPPEFTDHGSGYMLVEDESDLRLMKGSAVSDPARTDAGALLNMDLNTLTVSGETGTEYALAKSTGIISGTGIFQDWIDGEMANNGWLMVASHATEGQRERTREWTTTPEERPKLTIDCLIPKVILHMSMMACLQCSMPGHSGSGITSHPGILSLFRISVT